MNSSLDNQKNEISSNLPPGGFSNESSAKQTEESPRDWRNENPVDQNLDDHIFADQLWDDLFSPDSAYEGTPGIDYEEYRFPINGVYPEIVDYPAYTEDFLIEREIDQVMEERAEYGGEYNPHWKYWRSKIPSYNRRALWHDYTSRSHYMVTLLRNESLKSPFSKITYGGKDEDGKVIAKVELTEIGKQIREGIKATYFKYNYVDIPDYVIMPDHIHLHIYVSQKTDLHLTRFVSYIKAKATKGAREQDPDFAADNIPLFQEGYNDLIVTREGMKARLVNYINDNPRRYLIKKMVPDLFVRDHIIRGLGEELPAFGNFLLLRMPVKSVLTVSSHDTPAVFAKKKRIWEEVVRQGGVLVSPFYSPIEKKLRDEYIQMGAKIILLQTGGFGERYKPAGRYFDLCRQGRLLIIGEGVPTHRKETLQRAICLRLNDRARRIATTDNGAWLLRRRGTL